MPRFTDEFLWTALYGTKSRTGPERAWDIGVPVADFLDQVSGSDFKPAYQAAIDKAYERGLPRIMALPYAARINSPVFLDPPNNLRVNLNGSSEISGWTLELVGQGKGSQGNQTRLDAYFDDQPALWVGTGTGCEVANVNVKQIVSVRHPKLHNPLNTGIAVAGGPGGALQTTLRNCRAEGFYRGFGWGQNEGSQSESNLAVGCFADDCYTGFEFHHTNAVVNTLLLCQATAITGVKSTTEVKVIGGQWGHYTRPAKYVAISGVSTLTRSGSAPYDFTFTAVIASPGPQWADGVFNRFVLQLPHVGNVPLTMVSFNSGTSTATFKTWRPWILSFFYRTGDNFLDQLTGVIAELQAATHIYACEMITIGDGPIHFEDWRVELSTAHTMLYTNFDSRATAKLANGFTNGDISLMSIFPTPETDNYAHTLAQQSFPYIHRVNGSIVIENNRFMNNRGNSTDSVIFDLEANAGEFTWLRSDIFAPNIRGFAGFSDSGGYHDFLKSRFAPGGSEGYGYFDRPLHGPRATGAPAQSFDLRFGGGKHTPYTGWMPGGGSLPRITTSDVDAIALVADLTHPQDIAGNSIQQLVEHNLQAVSQSGAQQYALAKHAGLNWTYGAPLTVNWNYLAGTPFLFVSGTHAAWLFAGLKIILDNGGGPVAYIIMQVYPSFGYVTVHQCNPNGNTLVGASLTVPYTGTTIGQDPIILQKFGRQCEFATALSDLTGRRFYRDDIIWKASSSASASPGWICTTAGVVGSGAGFSPLANLGGETVP